MKIDKEKVEVTFPEFAMQCQSCKHEFTIQTTYDRADKATCPECESSDVKNLYISFSQDGPGFKPGYSSDRLTGGGCGSDGGGSCGS